MDKVEQGTAIEIGTGALTWAGGERRSDRYGTVWLMNDDENSLSQHSTGSKLKPMDLPKRGRLVAHVIATRESTHIGDLAHGVFPVTPSVGDAIVLCEMGTPFLEEIPGGYGIAIGIRPDEARETLWMNINNLYRAHEQTVRLVLETE